MKIKLLLSILSILSTFFAFTAYAETNKIKKDDLAQYQSCGQDSDCIIAQNGCCDCANGGEDVAISIRHQENFKKRFNCLDIMCTQLARDPACRTGVVSCIKGKCNYFEPSAR